jgi:hypothetical protein
MKYNWERNMDKIKDKIKDKIREAKYEYHSGAWASDPRNISPKEKIFLQGKSNIMVDKKTPLFTQRTLDSMIALSFCGGFIALGIAIGLSLK